MDSVDLLSDYHQAMITAARRVLTEHHKAAAADLRKLITQYPLLRSATLAQLFGLEKGVADNNADAGGGWAQQFVKALGRQRKNPHTYRSIHELVDRYYLRAVMREHKSIMRAAEHLQISRKMLRTRLQLLGLYDDDYS